MMKDNRNLIKKTLIKKLAFAATVFLILLLLTGCGSMAADTTSIRLTAYPAGLSQAPSCEAWKRTFPADADAGKTDGTQTDAETQENELVFASEDWGLGFGEQGTQPVGNASAADLKRYNAYYVGDDSEKAIYLTFDCGFENGNTEPILDALKKHKATAAFFVVGHYLESAPDLVKRMVEEGHAVGNHTYHHPDLASISEPADFQKEMEDVADLFQEITGEKLAMYYRPPQGKCSAANLKMAKQLGYSTVFWSLAYVDWQQDKQPGREEALTKLTARIHPGAVVLLHNTSRTNGAILDELLTKWEEMGYSFKPLSDLLER